MPPGRLLPLVFPLCIIGNYTAGFWDKFVVKSFIYSESIVNDVINSYAQEGYIVKQITTAGLQGYAVGQLYITILFEKTEPMSYREAL